MNKKDNIFVQQHILQKYQSLVKTFQQLTWTLDKSFKLLFNYGFN